MTEEEFRSQDVTKTDDPSTVVPPVVPSQLDPVAPSVLPADLEALEAGFKAAVAELHLKIGRLENALRLHMDGAPVVGVVSVLEKDLLS